MYDVNVAPLYMYLFNEVLQILSAFECDMCLCMWYVPRLLVFHDSDLNCLFQRYPGSEDFHVFFPCYWHDDINVCSFGYVSLIPGAWSMERCCKSPRLTSSASTMEPYRPPPNPLGWPPVPVALVSTLPALAVYHPRTATMTLWYVGFFIVSCSYIIILRYFICNFISFLGTNLLTQCLVSVVVFCLFLVL
jgi:hypothetical protein